MKRILLPTDFSKNSENAIRYAQQLFKDEKAIFYLLNTYSPVFYRADYTGVQMESLSGVMAGGSKKGLNETLERIKGLWVNEKHKFELISAFNLLTDEIVALSTQKKIDLIVMGTHGATGGVETLLGTNTVFVLRKAKIPVLVIPENHEYRQPKKVLFPTNYLFKIRKSEIKILRDLIKKHHFQITVLNVIEEDPLSEKQSRNKKRLVKRLKKSDVIFKEENKLLMPAAINHHVKEGNFELLIMINRKHAFLERLLLRQHIETLAFDPKVPFLVLRRKS